MAVIETEEIEEIIQKMNRDELMAAIYLVDKLIKDYETSSVRPTNVPAGVTS